MFIQYILIVCEGYCFVYQKLADYIGLPCRIARGCKYCVADHRSSCLVKIEDDKKSLRLENQALPLRKIFTTSCTIFSCYSEILGINFISLNIFHNSSLTKRYEDYNFIYVVSQANRILMKFSVVKS